MGNWISVKDRLPEKNIDCLCYYGFHKEQGNGMMFIGVLSYYACDKNPHWQHESTGLYVTHWMELPQPPEGVQHGD